MNILVTGAKGFVGKNLIETLKCIRDGKKRDSSVFVNEIYEYDINNTFKDLEKYTANCDFVFNFAGVNRPKGKSEFMEGNCSFVIKLLEGLKKHNNTCPIMMASSVQASLAGRFGDSEYGRSKLAGENIFFSYSKETGSKVLVYRFPNLFGKWCKPNYNSAVATFCNAFANEQPYIVNDESVELELLYIDDLVDEMLSALEGREHRCEYPKDGTVIDGIAYDGLTPVKKVDGKYCYAPITHTVSIKRILELLKTFSKQPETLLFSSIPFGSFEKKLYSTYLSYLPEDKTIFDLKAASDDRGSFTEFIRNNDIGQFSINVIKPKKTKGQHWHNTKVECFLVVSGHGLIQERQIGIDPDTGKFYPVREFRVDGNKPQCVYILPGYTHNIVNQSDSKDMVVIIWANEIFDSNHPETYREEV